MRDVVAYWLIGCLLVGAALPGQIQCAGHAPPPLNVLAMVAVWPVAVSAAIFAPPGFKWEPASCPAGK